MEPSRHDDAAITPPPKPTSQPQPQPQPPPPPPPPASCHFTKCKLHFFPARRLPITENLLIALSSPFSHPDAASCLPLLSRCCPSLARCPQGFYVHSSRAPCRIVSLCFGRANCVVVVIIISAIVATRPRAVRNAGVVDAPARLLHCAGLGHRSVWRVVRLSPSCRIARRRRPKREGVVVGADRPRRLAGLRRWLFSQCKEREREEAWRGGGGRGGAGRKMALVHVSGQKSIIVPPLSIFHICPWWFKIFPYAMEANMEAKCSPSK